ncbi:hypothetical protein EJ05DRAFT_10330 [Pseudovirgaria hyperparasitica]|uniref:Altered inheritance of mitochondria protein 6 n=1 Tax=Pseudovirgaria hyperparasitica TaxID=470096 RepID=A0A6A6WKM5_9PEZI|nr:uncharacterized protein EJ05DRAFT_10330 [Pseudovirgaria hyperparasitica]KAF2762713.1 hypothetical protein EJ05DRAFT_10330 [Pseudovirgaria hyperparasitica]
MASRPSRTDSLATLVSPSASPVPTFSPYKDDRDDTEFPLLDQTSASDEEHGPYDTAPTPTNRCSRFIMTLRQRFRRPKRIALSESDRPKASRKCVWCRRICIGIPVLVLMTLGLIHMIEVALGFGSALFEYEFDDFLPDYGRPGHIGEGLAEYPTDFTQNVLPIPCHSHNDYWRRVPLFQALHYGCTGVEADVWLFDNELFVGHNTASLTKKRTFRSLYVDPLLDILDRQNPTTEFANATHQGVFDADPDQTLVLLVDFKNNGADIWPHVYSQLEPLRSKGYLSYWDGSVKHERAITVVATGNAPFDLVVANSTRDIFFDAPLESFYETPDEAATRLEARGQGHNGVSEGTDFDESNSYYASVSFGSAMGILWGGQLSAKQMNIIRGQVQGAQRRGLKVRYWDTPTWPVGYRNHIWDVLIKERVDYLNVDDLKGAATRDWSA